LRRVPRQDRGRERIDRLLDAAAAVIAESGVDGATTNAIAARAKTAVGSLYQFFPNKEAIVEALAARYNAELRRINEETMPADVAFLPIPALIEHIVTPLAQFYIENPAYRHIYYATNGPQGPSCLEAELHKAVVARVERLMEIRISHITPERRHLSATVAVLVVHALLSFSMTASSATRDGIITELKRLMVIYINGMLGIGTFEPS
jgi:AcrR family transcriptional regulator